MSLTPCLQLVLGPCKARRKVTFLRPDGDREYTVICILGDIYGLENCDPEMNSTRRLLQARFVHKKPTWAEQDDEVSYKDYDFDLGECRLFCSRCEG
jgi:hypothetical protein